jgi:hypothetical protein
VGDEFDDFERRSLSEVSRDIPWFGGRLQAEKWG